MPVRGELATLFQNGVCNERHGTERGIARGLNPIFDTMGVFVWTDELSGTKGVGDCTQWRVYNFESGQTLYDEWHSCNEGLFGKCRAFALRSRR